MLNWQIGKKYRRRNGDISTMIGYYNEHRDIRKAIDFNDGNPVYAILGNRRANWIDPYDIIEEVTEGVMKIEVGKYYKTRSGHKAFVAFEYNSVNHFTHGGVVYGEQNAYDVTISWHPLGNHLQSTFGNDFDLIEEWKEPKSGVSYLNIYKDGILGHAYMNRIMADDAAHDVVRLACIRVEWKEGQFDD